MEDGSRTAASPEKLTSPKSKSQFSNAGVEESVFCTYVMFTFQNLFRIKTLHRAKYRLVKLQLITKCLRGGFSFIFCLHVTQ